MGMIDLDLDIQGFLTKVVCYVINAPTSYNLLLGRPWIHRYKVVTSTLHQCFQFVQDGQLRRINADIRPFTVTESFYSDAQFYDLSSGTDKSKEVIVKKSEKEEIIVPPYQEEARFEVDQKFTPEMRMELMKELAELDLEEEKPDKTESQAIVQPEVRAVIQHPILEKTQLDSLKDSQFCIHSEMKNILCARAPRLGDPSALFQKYKRFLHLTIM